MHRHAYAGRKLSRTTDARRALLRGMLDSLILYERIETTLAKAKELAPYFERQVTKAKKQTLASYRDILSETINPVAAQKLNYDLVKGFASREGGYTRIIKIGNRVGDGAPMAVIELVLDDKYTSEQKKSEQAKSIATTKTEAEGKAKPAKKSILKSSKQEEVVKTKITGSTSTSATKPKFTRRTAK